MIPDEGEVGILQALKDYNAFNIRLFKNDFTPSASTVIGDFTECDFTGYIDQALVFSNAVDEGDYASISSDVVTFTPFGSVSQTAYGYYITYYDGVSTTYLIGAERFDTPFVFVDDTTEKKVRVTLTGQNRTEV